MRKFKYIFFTLILFISVAAMGQQRINPVIKGYGGIFDAPHATERPDPNMDYKVVIDVATGDNDKSRPFYSLVNVARLMNLHAMGGLPSDKMDIVLAVHGGAIWSMLDNETYKEKFNHDNPNLDLFKELQDAGVKIFVCSQSMMGRNIDHEKLPEGVEVATSMLSTMTTYQLKGYAALKF